MAANRCKEEGNAKLKAKDFGSALECYAEGILEGEKEMSAFTGSLEELEPLKLVLTQLMSNQAHVLMLLERLDEAIESCEQAVSVDLQNTKAYWRGATAALKLKQPEVAADFLRRGLSYTEANQAQSLIELLGNSLSAWEEGAAEGGVASQYLLGLAFLKGNGIAKDPEKGMALIRRASEQGDELAQEMLAQVEKELADKASSVKNHHVDVWARAASQGDPAAQFNLGLAHLKGEGVAKDETKCIDLWKAAAQQGDEMATKNLEVLLATKQGAS